MAEVLKSGQRVMLWRDLPDDGLSAGTRGVVARVGGDVYGVVFDDDGKYGFIRVDIVLDGVYYRVIDLCGQAG